MPKSPREPLLKAVLKEFPGASKRTIARLLHDRHPMEFPSIEHARSALRYITGSNGDKLRKSRGMTKDTADIRKPTTFKMPKGTRRGARTYIAPVGRWLVTGDWHVPYHREDVLEVMLKYAVDNKITNLYLNGDICDFYQASHWVRDPKKRDVHYELQVMHKILDVMLKKMTGHLVYKIGNHEERLTKRVWQATPELACLPSFQLDRVLDVKKRGFTVVQSVQKARFGRLWGYHGHELRRGFTRPVNAARGIWNRLRDRAFASHFHSTSQGLEVSAVSHKMFQTYSIGCMCDLEPDYDPTNEWNHGFADVTVGKKGTHNFCNLVIDGGKVFGT